MVWFARGLQNPRFWYTAMLSPTILVSWFNQQSTFTGQWMCQRWRYSHSDNTVQLFSELSTSPKPATKGNSSHGLWICTTRVTSVMLMIDQVRHLQVKAEYYNLPISSSALPIKSINLQFKTYAGYGSLFMSYKSFLNVETFWCF